MAILREAGPDIVVATHSAEIIGECEPEDIVIVDKNRKRGRRVRSHRAMETALVAVGSSHNAAMSQVARTRLALLVEGDDFRTIARFARKLGLANVSSGSGFGVLPLGGFPTADAIEVLAK